MHILRKSCISFVLALILQELLCSPVPRPDLESDEIEDRRRRRRRPPCGRQDPATGRWFWGHDLTLFLGDVTLVNSPCGTNSNQPLPSQSSDTFPGQKPVLLSDSGGNGHRPLHQKPIFNKPIFQRPIFNRPIFQRPIFNRPGNAHPQGPDNKPVNEDIDDEDYDQDVYKPGSVVGSVNSQIVGQEQDLSNFSMSGFISQIGRHFNRLIDPFFDLFVR